MTKQRDGSAQPCGDCPRVFRFLGMVCLHYETKLRCGDDYKPLRTRDCITDKTKEKFNERT